MFTMQYTGKPANENRPPIKVCEFLEEFFHDVDEFVFENKEGENSGPATP